MQHVVPIATTLSTGPGTAKSEAEPSPDPREPRTSVVLLMLVAAAAAFSYLWAYAATDVLVSAGVTPPWRDGADPRPARLGLTFVGVLGTFLLVGMTARTLSGRQLRRIDAMMEE